MLALLSVIEPINSKPCGIDFLKIPKRTLLKQEGENYRLLKEDKWENLRIHMDFSFIENNIGKFDKKDLIDLKEKIMPKTQEVFQNLLKVKRIQNKLKLNTHSCDNYQIPDKYQSEGIDADLIIFVLIDDTGFFLQNKIEAGAIHCLQHEETRRPIAGYIQFKPQLNVNNSTALDYMVWLAVHEVSHILVINNALYEDYINPETLEPLGIDKVIGKKIMESGAKMNYVKSPKVLEKARNHFKCKHMDGVPLEYNGGAGTAGAHWAKKYMNTDYMIGDSYGENLISEITLGLFEDSGWYKVDYEKSNLFLWGKNSGCGFFDKKKKCIENATGKTSNQEEDESNTKTFINIVNKGKHSSGYTTDFQNEFCTNFNYPICSTSNIFRGICKVRKFPFKLSKNERYFSNPQMGGADSLTDKCPIAIEDKGDQSYYGGSCRVGNKDTIMMKEIEKICPECACFMSNLTDGNIKQRLAAVKETLFKKNLDQNHFKTENIFGNSNNSTQNISKTENMLLKINNSTKAGAELVKKNNMRKDQKSLTPNQEDLEDKGNLYPFDNFF